MIEEWRDVIGYESRYEVSSIGRVRSKSYLKHGRNRYGDISYFTMPKIIATPLNNDGYSSMCLSMLGVRTTAVVHRLVAQAFIPNPDNLPQVNHIDSNRANNRVENLEWVTNQQNVQHSYDSGSNSNKGEKHPRKVLTDDIVRQIREMWRHGLSVINIGKSLGFNRSTVSKVVHGDNWSHVT